MFDMNAIGEQLETLSPGEAFVAAFNWHHEASARSEARSGVPTSATSPMMPILMKPSRRWMVTSTAAVRLASKSAHPTHSQACRRSLILIRNGLTHATTKTELGPPP